MRNPTLVVVVALVASGCLGGALERRYPIGEPPPRELANAVDATRPIAELPDDVVAKARQRSGGPGARERATRFMAYRTEVTIGSGYQKRERRHCDYVLLDADGSVLGVYRLDGSC